MGKHSFAPKLTDQEHRILTNRSAGVADVVAYEHLKSRGLITPKGERTQRAEKMLARFDRARERDVFGRDWQPLPKLAREW